MWKGEEELREESRYSSLTRKKHVTTEENVYTGCTKTNVILLISLNLLYFFLQR
jgi:hypothetical protein